MQGMTPTDYIRELHSRIEIIIRENEKLKEEIKALQKALEKEQK